MSTNSSAPSRRPQSWPFSDSSRLSLRQSSSGVIPVNFRQAYDTSRSVHALEIKGISKAYGRFPALKNVSLQAKDKEFLALLGPSGSGKTTLLRVLAGLEQPDAGEVRFAGEDFLSLPVRSRKVGMVFQHYA